jgi:acetate---CoA ligase (ADP-forming)
VGCDHENVADGTARDLRPLFDPGSVAILGASNDPAKWGQWFARGALRGEHRRTVYLVNRSGEPVLERPTHRSLGELPGVPELVVIALPASAFEEAVDASLDAGARAIIAIAAGLGEMGQEGRRRERAVVERTRAAGAVLVGPNCMGVFDAETELDLATNDFPGGTIGLISQSGNLALEVSLRAAEVGLGVSRFVSVGNQADVEAAELIESLAAHERTRLIAVYLEDFRDGRRFARSALAARSNGKPLVLLAGGVSAVGVQAARSHTGALVSDSAAVDAACRAAGIVRVSTPQELVDAAQVLLANARPRGRRVAIVTDGGGSAVVAADLAAKARLDLPRLSAGLRARLAAIMPPTAVTTNPVDFAGAGEQDLTTYERVPRALLESQEVDAVFLTGYLGGYSASAEELRGPETEAARGLARAVADTGKAAVVQTMYSSESPARALREDGVAVFRDVDAALAAIVHSVDFETRKPRGVPSLPAANMQPASTDGYFGARALLQSAGVAFANAHCVRTAEDAAAAAAEVGYPVVLKALGLGHKSDAGGVAVGLEDERALRAALATMSRRLAPSEYSVEEQLALAEGVELLVGCRTDPRFGPILLVGLGGVLAEIHRDVAVALAPVEPGEVVELLEGLAGAALLRGPRGSAAVAVTDAAEAAAAVSMLAAEHPEIAEIEINPLLVTPTRAVGLDARVVYSHPR